ncbi:hypothetical protein [Massilia sp. H6]|uniref:hypothetical protein n=1 Tax=Massilia sp. H6 TaxID=2970464 RepID=UPI00216855DC|nr:hypothetical protein [Massilia sp. H6]UVW30558.1 hypothetical protein NRS07_19745 [Massilia sp. H6]
MKTDLYSRMYSRLEDLIPELSSISAPGASFYASPRSPTDMALFCSVASCSGDEVELELAKDEVVGGLEQAGHWMKFRIDRKTRTARLIACQTEAAYETIHGETIYPQSRHLPLNSFAVNWLGILVHLQFAFRTIVPAPSFN